MSEFHIVVYEVHYDISFLAMCVLLYVYNVFLDSEFYLLIRGKFVCNCLLYINRLNVIGMFKDC